MHDALVSDR